MVGRDYRPIDPSSPWLSPMPNVQLRGGLRGMVSQSSDPTKNILWPKAIPRRKREEFSYVGFQVV